MPDARTLTKDTIAPPAPTATPAAGTFDAAQAVSLSDADQTAKVHYTVDGTAPTAASLVFTAQLQITSPTRGWSASVYVASSPKAQLAQWGPPLASHVVNGTTAFDLHGRAGTAVLVWITDLGRNQSVSVGDARLTS